MNELAGKPVLEGRRLGSRLPDRVLWQDIDLCLNRGERLAIAGPSGSGKTVLLRTLAGLAPLQHGEIRFAGCSLAHWPMPDYRARVVYLAQRPTLPEGKVEMLLRAPFRFRVRRGQRFPQQLLDHYLQLLALDRHFLAKDSSDLSGGESQLVAALRTLLVAPDVLLLDEPTASLDRAAVQRLEALIRRWHEDSRACIWTSHDHAQLERVSDRVLTLPQNSVGQAA